MLKNGSYRFFYIKWDGEYLPLGCLTSDSFSESVEMQPTTTRDNGGWTTSVPTNQSYSLSVDGLIINTNFNGGDFSKISYDRLRTLKRNRTLIEWKTSDVDLTFVDSGKAYITNLSDTASVDEFISFNASFEGYHEPKSESLQEFELEDGNGNTIEDGNSNIITT